MLHNGTLPHIQIAAPSHCSSKLKVFGCNVLDNFEDIGIHTVSPTVMFYIFDNLLYI